MTQLVSLTSASPAPAPTSTAPPADSVEPRARLRLLETMTRLGEGDVARWEDDGGAVLRPAELAA